MIICFKIEGYILIYMIFVNYTLLKKISFFMTAIANVQALYPYSMNKSNSHNPTDREDRRKVRLIEGNAKCRYLKKLNCKGTLRQVFLSV
jgi:hypothetical protein